MPRKSTVNAPLKLTKPVPITGMRRDWTVLQRAYLEACTLPDAPGPRERVSALAVFDALRRLKACTALVTAAKEEVRAKAGTSSKLARALMDLEAATESARQIGSDLDALVTKKA